MIIETSDNRSPQTEGRQVNSDSTDELIRLLKERVAARPKPTATEAAAYVGMRIAEYGSYFIIVVAIAGFGIATGWIQWPS